MKIIPGHGVVNPTNIPLERNYTNFIRAYVDYTKEQEATERIHIWTALTVISATLQRKVWLKRAHHTVFPNLYTLIVADPGLFHKSTSTAIGVDLIRDISTIHVMADRITDASLIEALERSGDKFSVPVPGKAEAVEVRQSSLFCYAGEFSVLMKDAYGIVPELLTTFYDGGPRNSAKPWIKETRGSGQVKVYGPLTSMLACTTPSSLKECIPVSQMEAGLASRIVFVIETALPEKFVAIPKFNPELDGVRKKLFDDLLMIHDVRGDMTMTPEAEEYYTEWYESHMHFLHRRQGDRRFSGYFGRKPTQVEKVSILLSIAESGDRIIQRQHVEMAIEFLNQLEKPMLNVIEHGGKNADAPTLVKLDHMIRLKGEISDKQLRRAIMFEAGAITYTQLIEQLRQMGQIQATSSGGQIYYSPVPDSQELGAWQIDESPEAQEQP